MKPLDADLIRSLPKTDLHVHLDGSLRLSTLIELASEKGVKLPSNSEEGLRKLVFKQAYNNLPEYLKGFEYTVACLSDPESLERAAFELAEDSWNEGVRYIEVRFAPQLHVRPDLTLERVMESVCKGLARAKKRIERLPEVRSGAEPSFHAGVIICAMRYFNRHFSPHYEAYFNALPHEDESRIFALASLELARAAVKVREKDQPIVGFDLAGQERGFPAADHKEAYQLVHNHFLGKTVHAGEDYGPESIFQAITECNADRIGHGTWLFSTKKIHDLSIADKKRYVENLVRFLGDRRVTIEVCLTSNQQTIPDFRDSLAKHPYRKMRQARLSTTFCTDNRLVSNTTVTDEIVKAVETFKLSRKELRDQLVYGFKRSFFPGSYLEKRKYVREVIDHMNGILGF